MDDILRNLQRTAASGDISVLPMIDTLLRRAGIILIGYTDAHGNNPGNAVYIQENFDLYQVFVRNSIGQLVYVMAEEGTIGEHIAEFTQSEAEQVANNYLKKHEAQWVEGVCANPSCAKENKIVLADIEEKVGPTWDYDTDLLHLRCTECGYEWTDYSG